MSILLSNKQVLNLKRHGFKNGMVPVVAIQLVRQR